MQLNSYDFITILLPAALLCYFVGSKFGVSVRKLVICAFGAYVYYYAGTMGFVILIIDMAVTYLLAEIMMERDWLKKPMLALDLCFSVLFLLVFKYAGFAADNVNLLTGKSISLPELVMPLGISFLTFQQIAYVVSVYNGKISEINMLDYLTYVFYFPKLIMGPIVDPADMIAQFNDPARGKWNWDNFVSGIKLFSFGLFKKMVIADTFAQAVAWGSENGAAATSLDWILIMLSYTFEIYFDFSGYSDMATGVSNMMNITLPINFDSPYKAVSVRDFWRRWHVSLTAFLTQYIYIPLGGSRKGRWRTYLNVLIVFTISGIWHGANWTFILWGVLYGILSNLDRMIAPVWDKIFKPVRWLVTFAVINVLWLLFSADSVGAWISELRQILMGGNFCLSADLAACFRGTVMPALEDLLHVSQVTGFTSGTIWMALYMLAGLLICLIPKNNYNRQKNNNYLTMVLAAGAFAWSFLYLGTESVFIYNNF